MYTTLIPWASPQRKQNSQYEYEVSMPATVDVGNRITSVTWYELHATRKSDGKGTLVGYWF